MDLNMGTMAIIFIITAIIGWNIIDAVVETTVSSSSVTNESLGTANADGYLSSTLQHTPTNTPSIVCYAP